MIEIYLFIHPFGSVCYEAEKQLIDFMRDNSQKINLQILPLVNLQNTAAMMQLHQLDQKNLQTRNRFLNTAYAVALDFKAAQLQGKKYARRFLLKMQEALLFEKLPYSSQLAETLFFETGGDLVMFHEDRQSALVAEMFWQDQQTARELHIQQPTSAVVYNFYHEKEYGLLLQGFDALQTIPQLCQTKRENYLQFHHTQLKRANERALTNLPDLKLL